MVQHAGVHALVRRTHEERVLDVLREHGALSRADIAGRVGLSRTTLSDITADLLRRGAIVVLDTDASERTGSGRPAERLALVPSSGQFLGVDLGHRQVHVAVADASREVLATAEATWEDGTAWEERLRRTFDLVDTMAAERGVHFGALQAVGVGVPGPYRFGADGQSGQMRAWWAGQGIAAQARAAFARRFDAPVVLDNNARFAALAEALHAVPATRELLFVRLADGVGGGVVQEGRLVAGAAGLAGEFGHVRVPGAAGSCRCGKTGCLETVASVGAVLGSLRGRGVAVESLEDLAPLVAIEHPVVNEVLQEAGAAVGTVMAAVAMVVNPAEIVVAGEITRVAPRLVDAVAATARFELHSLADAAPAVRGAQLPANAGALGALAALVHQALHLDEAQKALADAVHVQRSIS